MRTGPRRRRFSIVPLETPNQSLTSTNAVCSVRRNGALPLTAEPSIHRRGRHGLRCVEGNTFVLLGRLEVSHGVIRTVSGLFQDLLEFRLAAVSFLCIAAATHPIPDVVDQAVDDRHCEQG